jgi:hypothetical protein
MGKKNPQNILNVYEDVRKKLQKMGDVKQKINVPKEGDVKIGEAPKTDLKKVKSKVEADKRITQELADEGQIEVNEETASDMTEFMKKNDPEGFKKIQKIVDDINNKNTPVESPYKFTGDETLDDLYELEEKGIISRNDYNVYGERYLDYVDAQVAKMFGYTEQEVNKMPIARLNVLRAKANPNWAEANYGDDYMRILEKERAIEAESGAYDDPGMFDNMFNKMQEEMDDYIPGEKPLTKKKRTLNAGGGLIGGGTIKGEDLGSRTGFKMVVNVSKLEKLKDLIEESNQRLDKINIKQLYLDAGYGAKGLKKESEAAKLIKNNLLTNEERIQKRYDLILNAPEDTPAEKLFNPIEKISKDMGLKRTLVSNTLNKYEPYQDTKQIRNFLTKDGFQRLAKNKNYTWGDVIDIAANRLDTSGEIYDFSRGSPEDRILNYAKMHFEKNRGTGKSKIKFLTDPKTTPRRDWEFTYKGKKFTAEDIFRKGRTFKEFEEIYNLADKIDSVKDKTINFKGETISVEDYLKQAYGQGTGKKGYYERTPFDIDHIEGISKDPFKNLRILPARINKGGGSINFYADKFGNVSKALKKIGYDYNQPFESLLENELKLADDIFTRDRKLKTPYQIAKETKSTKFKGTQKPILDPQIDPQTGKLKPVKPGEGFAKLDNLTKEITEQVSDKPPRIFNPNQVSMFGGAEFDEALKYYGPKVAKKVGPAAKGFGIASVIGVPLHMVFGRGARESLMDILSGGTYLESKDFGRRFNYMKENYPELLNDFKSATEKQTSAVFNPAAASVDYTDEEQIALNTAKEFDEKILGPELEATIQQRKQAMEDYPGVITGGGLTDLFSELSGRLNFEKGGSSSDKKKTTPALDKPTIQIDPNAPIDPGRRDFMEKGAGMGLGLGALATGLVKFAPEIKKAATNLTTTIVDEVPEIIQQLYFTIRNLGKTTDYGRDGIVKTKLGKYELIEEPGGYSITKMTDSDFRYQQEYFGVTTDPEKGVIHYEELTALPDMDGKLKDVDYGVELDTYREIGEDLAKIKGDDSLIKIADDDIAKQIEKEEAFKKSLQKKGTGEND